MTAPDWLDELAALEAAATACDWGASEDYDDWIVTGPNQEFIADIGWTGSHDGEAPRRAAEDARLIAAARNALPHLVRIARCAYAYRDGNGDALQFLDVLDAAAGEETER